MRRISAGLATCLVAAVTVGCGTVTASVSGHPGQRSGAPAATPARARVPSGCQAEAPRITQADNAKTFCVRVGATVTVLLRSSFSIWLQPLASSGALRPVLHGEASLVKGVTAALFAAVRPGQVLVTSVRPPCQVAISGEKGGLEPAEPVPTSYPLRFCPPGQRFSVAITVVG
jgi:hypothetical protein